MVMEMSKSYLEPGLYVNIFKVDVPNVEVTVFTASTSKYPSLRDLRSCIDQAGWKARVYKHDDLIFGYGQDAHQLTSEDFQQRQVRLFDYPKWCARLITEGLSDHLTNQEYRKSYGKGRVALYELNPYRTAAGGKLRVFRGYDLRTIYLREREKLVFGLVVDICWEIQDISGQRLNTATIAQYNAVVEVAQIQDELLPNNRINPEVSRLRLREHILPFVAKNKKFRLPLSEGIEADLEETPVRIILGGPS